MINKAKTWKSIVKWIKSYKKQKRLIVYFAPILLLITILVGIIIWAWIRTKPKQPQMFPVQVLTSQVYPQTIYSSTELNQNFLKANLIDGNLNTAWSSKSYGITDPGNIIEWSTFDFGSAIKVARIIIYPHVYNNQIQSFPLNWNISYSDDGTHWQIYPGREFITYQLPGPNGGQPPELIFSFAGNTHRYMGVGATRASPDELGEYKVQLAEIKFFSSECTTQADCDTAYGEECREGVCGIDTEDYWNLKPGSYWMYSGEDRYNNQQPFVFHTRIDVEKPNQICPNNPNPIDVLTWRVNKTTCNSPYKCWWGQGNLRWMMADPASNPNIPYIWTPGYKAYHGQDSYPDNYTEVGFLKQRVRMIPISTPTPPYTQTYPSYLNTPIFLTDFEDNLIFRYQDHFCGLQNGDGSVISDGDLCDMPNKQPSECAWNRISFNSWRYHKTTVQTPGYSGPALMISQSERDGWCTREDWYLAKDIGLVRIDQWTCNDQNQCYSPHDGSCNCAVGDPNLQKWYYQANDHPACYDDIAIDTSPYQPKIIFKLDKYYLGSALGVKINNQTSIAAQPGDQLTFTFTDHSTPNNFPFEGFVEINYSFISPGGAHIQTAGKWGELLENDVAWVSNGQKTVTLGNSLSNGSYTINFRPKLFEPPPEAISSGSEKTRGTNQLPWSNTVTLNILSKNYVAFVSSQGYSGNLEGLTGADQKCQSLASAAGLTGTFKAWLSDWTVNAKDRIPDAKYALKGGTITVADNKADLIDGTLDHSINVDEKGNRADLETVWTGTDEFGVKIQGSLCNIWANNTNTYQGMSGKANGYNNATWTKNANAGCSQTKRLYCFQTGSILGEKTVR